MYRFEPLFFYRYVQNEKKFYMYFIVPLVDIYHYFFLEIDDASSLCTVHIANS